MERERERERESKRDRGSESGRERERDPDFKTIYLDLGKQIPLNRFWPWCNGRPWCKGKVQYHGSHVHLLERIEMAKNIQNCTPQGSNKRLLTPQSPIFANCTACTCFKCCYSVFKYLALPQPVRPAGGVEGCKRQSQPVNRPGGAGGGESSKRAPALAA